MHDSTDYIISFILVLIFFTPVYIVTRIAHNMAENESAIRTKIKNREDSLIDNIIHFLFYWHNEETNIFIFSKTKTISLLIYVIFVLYRSYSSTSFLTEVLKDNNHEEKEIPNTTSEHETISKPKTNPVKQIKNESKPKQTIKKHIFDSY